MDQNFNKPPQDPMYQQYPPPYVAGHIQQPTPASVGFTYQPSQPAQQQFYPQQSHAQHAQHGGYPITQQPTVHNVYVTPVVGPSPSNITCPSCQKGVVTRMEYETSSKTHLCACILCCFICWPIAWLPYVMDSCKNGNHYCPACGQFVGTYSS